jgi:hypothetical protein
MAETAKRKMANLYREGCVEPSVLPVEAQDDERSDPMTITIDAPAEIEAAIMEKAARAGLSVPEYTLRALTTDFPLTEPVGTQEDQAQVRKEAMALIESGYYAVPGAGSVVLLAARADEARREEERFEADYGTAKNGWVSQDH